MNQKTNAYFLMRLLQTGGIGPVRVREILDWLGHTETDCNAISNDEMALRKILNEKQYASFVSNKDIVDSIWATLETAQIRVVTLFDSEYPNVLRQRLGRRAPPVLFVNGNLELLKGHAIGFCGSRQATAKGLETAADIANQLADRGFRIISGYASGVDMATHRAALEAGGATIIVLAEGITHFRVKGEIKDHWDWNRTLVISEFLPRLPWTAHNAMQRNITICGLSGALIVIEAGEKGGTIEAGKAALNLKVPLFVAVYENAHALGNDWLLERGGLPVMKSRISNRANVAGIAQTVEGTVADAKQHVLGFSEKAD